MRDRCYEHLEYSLTSFARNSTSPLFSAPAETYWASFDQISQYNVHLNVFERLWAAWYAYIQNDVLATGIMSFLMHEIVYFGRSLPWLIIDRIQYFNKYKIQNVSTYNTLRSSETMTICSHVCSKKYQQPRSSGIAPSWSCSLTSPSNFPKYGS